ncbi:unnamed protein product, partial [Polarella glacialis]
AEARHVFEFYGLSGDTLDAFPVPRAKTPAPEVPRRPLGPPPDISSPKPTFSNYDPTLTGSSGLGFGSYAHGSMGGPADHHTTQWAWTSPPPSRGSETASGSQRSIRRSGSEAGRSAVLSRSSVASRRSESRVGSRALSAAVSSGLLKREVEEAVQRELSRLATPLI